MCVVIKSLVKRSWLSLALLVYCVRAEGQQAPLALAHTPRPTFRQKEGAMAAAAECAANKKSPTQTILAGIHCDAKENKGGGPCLFSVCFLWVHRRANFWSQTKLAASSVFSFSRSTATQLLKMRGCFLSECSANHVRLIFWRAVENTCFVALLYRKTIS
jgi:hypothetical protein